MKKSIGAILIVAALGLGFMGFNKMNASTESVEILNVELSASDSEGKNTAYIFFGLAVVSLIGGVVLLSKKS